MPADLCKSRVDLENVTELMRLCADGVDTKSTVNIPELPEAAVAKVTHCATLRATSLAIHSPRGSPMRHPEDDEGAFQRPHQRG